MCNAPLRNTNKKWEQKAKRFAEHLENTFQPNQGDDPEEWNDIYQSKVQIKAVTPKEVQKEIKILINFKKAPGYELVTGEILKQFPKK